MSWANASTSDQALTKQFGKDTRMLLHSAAPFNLESSLALLADAITPNERFFMRNNHAIPTISPTEWRLTIDGLVERPYTLSYVELRQLPSVRMIAFLECYGNAPALRRAGTAGGGHRLARWRDRQR